MATDFGRVLTAMVTPFEKDFSVNFDLAKKLARYLVQSGSDGLVVSGTTGESPTLSREEKIELFRVIVEEVGGEATVIAGTGSYDTAGSADLTRAAERVGVDGLLLVAPYYNKPSQEGLYQHYKAVAKPEQFHQLYRDCVSFTSIIRLWQRARIYRLCCIISRDVRG